MAYKINGTTVVDNSRNVCACCVTSCCVTASTRLDAPSGTTANRPASPATGSLYFDTDEGSLLSYDGASWAAVGGGSDPVSFCGMCCLTGCCIELVCPSGVLTYYCMSRPGSSGWYGPGSAATGTRSINCFPIVGQGYCKPFHVSSDGTTIYSGMAVNSSGGGFSLASYTSIGSKDGSSSYRIRSGSNKNTYTPSSCILCCTCICAQMLGPSDNNRHVPLLSYSGFTDNCNKGYLAHHQFSCIENCKDCGWIVPYASVYDSTCPVYKMCGGTAFAKRPINRRSMAKASKIICLICDCHGFSCLIESECVNGFTTNLFCEGTGFGCGCCICCPGWTDTEMGISHPCGFHFLMTRDPTDLRYYPSSGETRSSLDGGTCGRLQGLFTISCCNSSCACIKNNHQLYGFELPHQCAGAAFAKLPNNAQNCTFFIIHWDYCTCCTKMYYIPCCSNTQLYTPWLEQCTSQGYSSWQKDPVDDDVYYYLTFCNSCNYGTRCLFLCGSRFDFSGGVPCYICEFVFRSCQCFTGNCMFAFVPVYYDLETCGMVSLYTHGANQCCKANQGIGFIVEKFDFTNCTHQVLDYSCFCSYPTRGMQGCQMQNCSPPNWCQVCTCYGYINTGFGTSPDGRFGIMVWGGPDSNMSGARLNYEWMVANCCARSTRICCTNFDRSALANSCCAHPCICTRPLTCPICTSYGSTDRTCTLTLLCNGTGIVCWTSTKVWLGPRNFDDFCCGPSTCPENTYNRWPVLHDAGYTMGDVIRDYELRCGADSMSCSWGCSSSNLCAD